jgi:hypothetical protein
MSSLERKWSDIRGTLSHFITLKGSISVSEDEIEVARTLSVQRKGRQVSLSSKALDERMGKVGTEPNIRIRFFPDRSQIIETYYFAPGHLGVAEVLKEMAHNPREFSASCGDKGYTCIEIKSKYSHGIGGTIERLDKVSGNDY